MDVLIYVALAEEFNDSIAPVLDTTFTRRDVDGLSMSYMEGYIDSPVLGRKVRLGVVASGTMGNTAAAGIVSAMLKIYQPAHVVVIGIAGSISRDLQLGSVFIPSSVKDYTANNYVEGVSELKIVGAGKELNTSGGLEKWVSFPTGHKNEYNDWTARCSKRAEDLIDDGIQKALTALELPVIRGAKLVVAEDKKLGSGPFVVNSDLFAKQIREHIDRKISAVEMESSGVYYAASIQKPSPGVIAIRGVSDFADGRKTGIDKAGEQKIRKLATMNAADLLREGIRLGFFPPKDPTPVQAKPAIKRALDIDGEWISYYDRAKLPSGEEEHDWMVDKVKIVYENGVYWMESTDEKSKDAWKARAYVNGDDYFNGIWSSKHHYRVEGSMAFRKNPDGTALMGHYIGRNSNGASGEDKLGQWILVKADENQSKALAAARAWLNQSLPTFRSDKGINAYRRQYHSYHLTQMGGTHVWRHHVLDFRSSDNPHLLTTSLDVQDAAGVKRTYHIFGGKRGSHLLVFFRTAAGERQSITVFPFFNATSRNYGLISGENWDGNQFLGKVILSESPITGIDEMGSVPIEKSAALNEEWNKLFTERNRTPADMLTERTEATRGITPMYDEVTEYLKKRDRTLPTKLRILGLTLFSVPGMLKSWQTKKLLVNLDIELMHLSDAFLSDQTKLFPKAQWGQVLPGYLSEIKKFVTKEKETLKKNKVKVTMTPYSHVPGVHGVAIGDELYMIAFASWDTKNTIQIPHDVIFLKVEKLDPSEQAQALRELFENWVKAAKTKPRGK